MGTLRNGVRYRMLTRGENFDMELDSPLVTHSIAEMMTIAEGLSVAYKDCIVPFENMLLNCWQSFELIGDVTISMSDELIIAHTRHQDNSLHQMYIVVMMGGTIATALRLSGEAEGGLINDTSDYVDLLERMGRLRLNRTRKIRTAADL